ncbi:hypothetical protein [Dinoroseobacter shibae]|nr:hypothetical protein [Dinoroseobacter shibae]
MVGNRGETLPILALILVVPGGIYTGWTTPVEAGRPDLCSAS